MKRDSVKPDQNAWMANDPDPAIRSAYSALERQRATKRRARGGTASLTAPSGPLVRIAQGAGRSPEEVASSLPPELVKRTQYPVIEQRTPDGKITFKHPSGIVEGRLHAYR